MMPVWLSVLVQLGFGAGILAIAWQGHCRGEIPAGTNFWRAFRPTREDDPIAFHCFLALYFCGGLALSVWGLLTLIGMAPPMRWR
jgi:hypothetical protein